MKFTARRIDYNNESFTMKFDSWEQCVSYVKSKSDWFSHGGDKNRQAIIGSITTGSLTEYLEAEMEIS